jgi:hypothetical protein
VQSIALSRIPLFLEATWSIVSGGSEVPSASFYKEVEMNVPTGSGLLLASLEGRLLGQPEIRFAPLPTDRWIARSCLQKAVRRGNAELAVRALATLIKEDRYGIWRHLIIIAFEDVGAANFGVVAELIAASADRKWRERVGGTWRVAAFLASELATGPHCQAACDLLLRARNAANLQSDRIALSQTVPDELAGIICSPRFEIEKRAVAVLALAGEYGARPDPALVLHALDNQAYSGAFIEQCALAWTKTRDPMTLLFPLIWESFLNGDNREVISDYELPLAVDVAPGVPGYVLDQFTRTGNSAARMLLARRSDIRESLSNAGIASASQPRALGDLIFLVEGGLLHRRMSWPTADNLRLPLRSLPVVSKVGSEIENLLGLVSGAANDLAGCRQRAFAEREG